MNTIKTFATILSFCVQSATSLSASCTFLGSTELSLSITISPEDVESGDLAECFDEFGRENIEKLRMTDSGNYFTSLPDDLFQDMVNMEYIAIESDGLTTLPSGIFEDLGSLKEISLYENYDLTSLPEGIFNGLDGLETITLSDCGLSTLPEGIFQGLQSLVVLSLHGNTFRTLPDNVFDGLVSLEELRLSENELTELSPGIFSDLTSLLELDIDDNFLLCYPESLAREITADDGVFECEDDGEDDSVGDGGFTSSASIIGYDLFYTLSWIMIVFFMTILDF